jgi:hypothetical protein
LVVVLALVIGAIGFRYARGPEAGTPAVAPPSAAARAADPPMPAVAPTATTPPASKSEDTDASAVAEFETLKGRWRRPDGGYIIEVREVNSGGRLDAAYFNPQPINVARAEAAREGERIRVFIELRDVNYPGSTYTLVYEPAQDQLQGVYFQAAMGASFEVLFERLK